jgi:hypothetical protein
MKANHKGSRQSPQWLVVERTEENMKRKKNMRKQINSVEDIHYNDELFDTYDHDFLDISFDDEEMMPKEEQYVYG